MEVLTAILGISFLISIIYILGQASNHQKDIDYHNQLIQEGFTEVSKYQKQAEDATKELAIIKENTVDPNKVVELSVHEALTGSQSARIASLEEELRVTKGKYEKERGKAISERVRLGHISENIAPFLDTFPYDRSKVKALFQPIDLIYFGEDEVVFIDVKSGDSQLSTKQRKIRDLIKEGKVRFEVHRINDKGYNIK